MTQRHTAPQIKLMTTQKLILESSAGRISRESDQAVENSLAHFGKREIPNREMFFLLQYHLSVLIGIDLHLDHTYHANGTVVRKFYYTFALLDFFVEIFERFRIG